MTESEMNAIREMLTDVLQAVGDRIVANITALITPATVKVETQPARKNPARLEKGT